MIPKLLKYTFWFLGGLGLLLAMALVAFESKYRPGTPDPILVGNAEGYLTGVVTEPTGPIPFTLPGIPGAQVTLSPGEASALTDREGVFALPGLPPRVYTVTISKGGYETATIDQVAVSSGRVTTLPDEALFAQIKGPPIARLKVGNPVPFSKLPEAYPYRTTVYLDAMDSENISRNGIEWEIRDPAGRILLDPHAKKRTPLQLMRSPIPGTPPGLFLFKPPGPGLYKVKITLTNRAAPGVSDSAEVAVQAVNEAPEAVATVIAGPAPPGKIPDGNPRSSSGLQVVSAGQVVTLMGHGLDRNHAAPEQYNPGAEIKDVYGKNHDRLAGQFGFAWRLFHTESAAGPRTDVSDRLRGPTGNASHTDQVVHFRTDKPGRYDAELMVHDNDPSGSLLSEPAVISIHAIGGNTPQDGSSCVSCHRREVDSYRATAHGTAEIGCEQCHGPAEAHLAIARPRWEGAPSYRLQKRTTQAVNRGSGLCGQCHEEYGEWEKSNHADGMSYGYYEIARPLLTECTKCHYARTFRQTLDAAAETGVAFHEVRYRKRAAGIGPLMPDMSKLPRKDETGISCVTCHRVHGETSGRQSAGTMEKPEMLCQTCHHQKWQNATLEGRAGALGNGHEYPNRHYAFKNPHNRPEKCLLCHGGDQDPAVDGNGIRRVGGHTFRMRDVGPDGVPGGFGPRHDNPAQNRDPANTDDVLHLAPCRGCHDDDDDFDRSGVQGTVFAKWTLLGDLLKRANSGVLPGYRPGDKCATCHRGGTLPFDDDPTLILESAYTNHKLVEKDRSWGVHNPKYVLKILDDSIEAVKRTLETRAR